ncbi:MAG: hypothetical protein ABIP48_20975 [Planctomycetota bacterium]
MLLLAGFREDVPSVHAPHAHRFTRRVAQYAVFVWLEICEREQPSFKRSDSGFELRQPVE